ncbi:hypothetical protein GF386_00545 [Candidatus Pacearchaeota archaeon]|nr:hypothetical protein [Candidatus Pacearchaeota archaeon]MBD3282750.1 hypothetical protein [Candidatus Pacearchaeota archaeon]
MALFKKRCAYCKEKIDKDDEVWEKVKVPEFKNRKNKVFCSKEHAELYKKNVKGTPSKSLCPYCKE